MTERKRQEAIILSGLDRLISSRSAHKPPPAPQAKPSRAGNKKARAKAARSEGLVPAFLRLAERAKKSGPKGLLERLEGFCIAAREGKLKSGDDDYSTYPTSSDPTPPWREPQEQRPKPKAYGDLPNWVGAEALSLRWDSEGTYPRT